MVQVWGNLRNVNNSKKNRKNGRVCKHSVGNSLQQKQLRFKQSEIWQYLLYWLGNIADNKSDFKKSE